MADVKIIDIDGEQWDIKDQEARSSLASVETQLENLVNTDIPKYRTWEKLGQGISSSISQASMSIDVTDKTELLFCFRTSSSASEALASCVVPLSEFKSRGIFNVTYLSYVPSNAYMRFVFLSRTGNIISLSVTQNGVSGSVGVVFGR